MKKLGILVVFFLGLGSYTVAQTGEVRNDTIYWQNDVNKPVEFSKAIGKYLFILDVVPQEIPPKQLKLSMISTTSKEVDVDLIQVIDGKHILIPLEAFQEKYYTLYFKKGNATILGKKLICR